MEQLGIIGMADLHVYAVIGSEGSDNLLLPSLPAIDK